MKVLLFISTLILIVSCGKYERPFISFKSPEKRLTEGTWGCTKAVDSAGNEFEVADRITFSIDGSDSIFTRRTNYFALQPANITANNQNNITDTTNGYLEYYGNWTWGYALDGKKNKQIMKLNLPFFSRNNRITVLSNEEFVYQDQSFDNTTYHYKKL